MTFAPEKTQAMVCSRSPAAKATMAGKLFFRDALPHQVEVKILGVEVDQRLRFDSHVKAIAKKASQRISALRRVAGFLDRKKRLLLYKAQVRPHLEYAALSWMSCAATHRKRLDSICWWMLPPHLTKSLSVFSTHWNTEEAWERS